jgi:hypothetical protein
LRIFGGGPDSLAGLRQLEVSGKRFFVHNGAKEGFS